jgi:hypothetical protein
MERRELWSPRGLRGATTQGGMGGAASSAWGAGAPQAGGHRGVVPRGRYR